MIAAARHRRAPSISLEACPVAASTLAAADYLVRQNDAERLRQWLARHSAPERAAILRHLEHRNNKVRR